MVVKNIIDESFQDYYKTAMFIATSKCDGKCWREQRLSPDICQNYMSLGNPNYDIPDRDIIERYVKNPLTKAIVFGGLEPMMQIDELVRFIDLLRNEYGVDDDVCIYTGYYEIEVQNELNRLKKFDNIFVKFGRYIHGSPSRFDDILGVTLASKNQYAKKIS